jgi:hypothetical protein
MSGQDVAAVLSGGQAFEGLVAQLLQPEDEIRSRAEAVFEQLKQQPDALVGNFLVIMRGSANVEHRQFAAIMLRKVRHTPHYSGIAQAAFQLYQLYFC